MGLADALIPGVASGVSSLSARKQLKFKEFTSSGNFVIGSGGDATSAATVFNILLVGAGGGGGMGSITALGAGTVGVVVGGAGGGGEVQELVASGVSLLNGGASGTITVTIGAGGVGGASSNGGTAAVGGDSIFGRYTSFGGGRAGSTSRNLGVSTTVNAQYRATGASSSTISQGTVTAARVAASSGGGGGQRFSSGFTTGTDPDALEFIFWGPQNGRVASGTVANTYGPDSQLPLQYDNNANDASLRPWCGHSGNRTYTDATINNAWYGRGGMGLKGIGGGGAGAIASYGGTTVATVLVLPTNYFETDYNQAKYYSVDGGGRGAIVTGNATANYIAATSGTANTGGGGGGGAAWGTATTVYNSVSAGGSGAAGYCLVYWWE
jgi:hypothetical protein